MTSRQISRLGMGLWLMGCLLGSGLAGADAALLGDWPLRDGEGTQALDRAAPTRHGTIKGDAQWLKGDAGSALYFGGGDGRVEIPHDADLNGGKGLTFEAWVALQTKGRTAPIVGKGGQAYASKHVQLFLGSTGTLWQFSVSDGKRPLAVSAGKAELGKWVHLVGTWEPSTSTIRIYKNGIKVAQRKGTVGDFATKEPLRIGGQTQHIAGLIGDVKVYNRVLAAGEGAASFKSGSKQPRNKPADVFAELTKGKLALKTIREIVCGGVYPGHVQGLDMDEEHIYWSFTTTLVKTDRQGKVLKTVKVPYHHGGITVFDGKLFAARMPGRTVKVYKTDDLSFIRDYDVPKVRGFPGGMEYYKGHFYIAEGTRDSSFPQVYRYDLKFRHLKTYTIPLPLHIGIQTIGRSNGFWWLGTYDPAHPTVKLDDEFKVLGTRHDLPTAYGVKEWAEDTMVTGVSGGKKGAYTGKATVRKLVRE